MANGRVALDDPMSLGQTIQSRASGKKALALVSLVLVGAVVGFAFWQQDPHVEEPAVEMPTMMKVPTASSQARGVVPVHASMAHQVKPTYQQHANVLPPSASCSFWNTMMRPRAAAAAAASRSPVSVRASAGGVTKEDVIAVQTAWANAIKEISASYKDGGDYVALAGQKAGELYAYGKSPVLFKPTKAAEYQFRPTAAEAMSYFVGNKAVENGYAEDGGFAINGGRGWSDCVYDNHEIVIKGDIGIAMGNYVFTDATDGSKNKVEYTFGYERCDDGKVRIFLHHSSVPYSR